MSTINHSTTMFDAVTKAVSNSDNWVMEDDMLKLDWTLVGLEVFAFCGPEDEDEVGFYHADYASACDHLEYVRGEKYPSAMGG